MRLSFIDDEPQVYPMQYGGKARTILALARSALELGVADEVTVLSRSIDDTRDYFVEDDINYTKLGDNTMIGRIAEEAEEADILSVHTCSFTFPSIPPDRRKAGLIYHLHDVMLTTADKGSHLDKALAGEWDAIVSPSDFATTTYRNFAAITGSKAEVHTIPRGVNPELFHPVDKIAAREQLRHWGINIKSNAQPILFFPGRSGVGKGDDRIRKICDSLAEQYSDFLVVTAADEDTEPQHPNVKHIGWQETDKLRYFYSAADLTLSLSRLPESFSQVCIESVACGTAVLAFPFGNQAGLSESLPAVQICQPTTESIISNIHQLLTDPSLADTIQQSQAAIETNYSIGSIGKTYARLYMDIIGRRQQEGLAVPALYFISPFAAVHNNIAYVSGEDNSTLGSHNLTPLEAKVLQHCGTAISSKTIASTLNISDEMITSTLEKLVQNKVIIGGRNGRIL